MNEALEKTETELSNDDWNITSNLENDINNYRDMLKTENLENIDAKKYDYPDGVFFMDIVSECERLGDYVVNVVQTIVKNE
jgi:phosphate:Na+ symporter